MNRQTKLALLLAMEVLIWAGMVAGISFIEAPVKFTAPKVTLAIGLGIGRLVFGWLNKAEIILCATMLLAAVYSRPGRQIWTTALSLTVILLIQTFWLLPALDVRALAIIAGENVPASNLHFVYVALEMSKLILLIITGYMALKHAVNSSLSRRKVYSNQPVPELY